MLGTSGKSRTGNSRQQLPTIRHYIPTEFNEVPSEMFDPAYMDKLYKLGYQMSSKDYPWFKTPPDFIIGE